MRFSVIIPAYNASEVLERTVRSALEQTYPDFEVVISDDGSSDDTLDVANALAKTDPRVRVVTGPNGGCSVARNRGVEAASGEFCVLLDSDDMLKPEYVATMSAFIDRCPDYDIYSCNGDRLMTQGRTEPFLSGPVYAGETSLVLDDIIIINHVFIMSAFRRELFERLGGFRSDLRYAEDYDFWLRALALGARHRFIPQRLGVYVESAGSKSKNRIPHAQAQIRIFESLAAMPELTEAQRALCARKLEALRIRIRRVELETRVVAGEYAGARAEYLRVGDAYLDKRKYAAGLFAMMLSPRLYARLFAARASKRAVS
ncbi:MAG: glycosyltransferase [Coriobacteriia bacterium]|nr:glycosyltransferase [Coriobacteriia bacterium]